jgi:hypothetical protein
MDLEGHFDITTLPNMQDMKFKLTGKAVTFTPKLDGITICTMLCCYLEAPYMYQVVLLSRDAVRTFSAKMNTDYRIKHKSPAVNFYVLLNMFVAAR